MRIEGRQLIVAHPMAGGEPADETTAPGVT